MTVEENLTVQMKISLITGTIVRMADKSVTDGLEHGVLVSIARENLYRHEMQPSFYNLPAVTFGAMSPLS
ncbi:MAG: hypothetical protein JXR85_12185 [Deltaproteobacteria bacterium]|nr:hypothetical protein [Deltaproteobacteria bacterium]